MFAWRDQARSSPVSAIHLASTSSESGRRESAIAPGQVGELDAVLAQQAARLRHVGDDRLVRVDQVGVRAASAGAALGAAASPRGLARASVEPPVDADEAEVAVHRPLLVVHAGAQQLAGALLGAALAAGVAGLDPRAAPATAIGRAAPAPRAPACSGR